MTCITRSSEMEIVKLHRMPMSKNTEGSKEEGKKSGTDLRNDENRKNETPTQVEMKKSIKKTRKGKTVVAVMTKPALGYHKKISGLVLIVSVNERQKGQKRKKGNGKPIRPDGLVRDHNR